MTKSIIFIGLLAGALPACGEESVECTTGSWSAPEFEANAAEGLALRSQLDALVGRMRSAEEEVEIVDEMSDLTALYEAGDMPLSSIVPASMDAVVQNAFSDFVAIGTTGVVDLIDDSDMFAPGASGGIHDTRGINTGGLEVRQLVDKGLFGGGALYVYALSLTEGEITPEKVEAIAALFGTNAALDAETRTDSANYAYGMGMHAMVVDAFTEAHDLAADSECATERDQALVQGFRLWEQALVARTVYYANVAHGLIAGAAAGADAERIDAIHELSEGIGLTLGFYGMPEPAAGPLAGAGRVITDANIESMMTSLGVNIGDLGASTTGAFLSDPSGFATAVDAVEAEVQSAFALTADEVAAFATPTDG